MEFIRERIKEVGIKEPDVDDMEWRLTRRIFTSDLPLAKKLHFQHWLEKITEIGMGWISTPLFSGIVSCALNNLARVFEQ